MDGRNAQTEPHLVLDLLQVRRLQRSSVLEFYLKHKNQSIRINIAA